MAPLIRRLDLSGLYSQTIYNFSIRGFSRCNCSFRWQPPARSRVFSFPVHQGGSRDPRGPVYRDVSWNRIGGLPSGDLRNAARLAHSISQRGRRRPIHGGTFDSPPHGFQLFHFDGATLALPKVLLAPQRIRHVQFSVEKRMDVFPLTSSVSTGERLRGADFHTTPPKWPSPGGVGPQFESSSNGAGRPRHCFAWSRATHRNALNIRYLRYNWARCGSAPRPRESRPVESE